MLPAGGSGEREMLYEKALPLLARGRDVVVLAPVADRQLPGLVAPALLDLPKAGKGPLRPVPVGGQGAAGAALRSLQALNGPRAATTLALSEEHAVRREARDLEERPDAVVATPARLIDHIRRNNICLSAVRCTVILEGGAEPQPEFRRDVQFIASKLPRRRQTVVVAAGLTRESAATIYPLRRPVFVEPADLVSRPAPAPGPAGPAMAPAGGATRRSPATRQERPAVSNTATATAAPEGRRSASIPDEKILGQALETILKTIRQQEDPEELNGYRKVFKKHVPIFMRSYVAAYLFKKGLEGIVTAPLGDHQALCRHRQEPPGVRKGHHQAVHGPPRHPAHADRRGQGARELLVYRHQPRPRPGSDLQALGHQLPRQAPDRQPGQEKG